MNQKEDALLYQQTALDMLRRYGLDLNPAPTPVGMLARRMKVILLNAEVEGGEVESLDFGFAPEQMPEGYRRAAGKDIQKVVKVRENLPAEDQRVLIASMLVLMHVTADKDPDREEHRRKRLVRKSVFSRADLTEKLAAFRLTALCVMMPPAALAYYFSKKEKTSVGALLHNVKKLDRFCLAFSVSQQEAIDRLSLLRAAQREEE